MENDNPNHKPDYLVFMLKDTNLIPGFDAPRPSFSTCFLRGLCAGGHEFIMERYNSAFDLTPYSFPLRDPSDVQLPRTNGS